MWRDKRDYDHVIGQSRGQRYLVQPHLGQEQNRSLGH